MKSFTLDGKRHRLLPVVPIQQIGWLVQRMHVSDTDDEVRAAMRNRAAQNLGWTEQAIKQAENYAVYCHRNNQAVYGMVA